MKVLLSGVLITVAWLAAACSRSIQGTMPSSTTSATPGPEAAQAPSALPTVTTSPAQTIPGTPSPDKWIGLLLRTPYPYSTPLPPPTSSPFDGIYAKFEDSYGTPIPCRRCPDYAPFTGVWRLQFDNGIFRTINEATGWASIGSFTASGDRLLLFNDANCIEDVGTYQWKLEKGQLTLHVIKDDCAIGQRARNFVLRPWLSCQPPNLEAAITDHWFKPPICR